MKKFLLSILLAVFPLFLFSCNMISTAEIIKDSEKTALSHNVEKTVFVANKSSRTYHTPACYIAKRITDENRLETTDLRFLHSRQFKPCKICIESE